VNEGYAACYRDLSRHATPCHRTYTAMMIHDGGTGAEGTREGKREREREREALRFVLIDVIDIGIRRRADYSAVNNSARQPPCRSLTVATAHSRRTEPPRHFAISIGTTTAAPLVVV